MFKSFPSLVNAFNRIKKNPQLFWTIFVAIVITGAFIVIANLFISIASDAQDRLVNIRIGSIQDSLSEFVILDEDSKEKNKQAIVNLMSQNPTILEFTFYKKEENGFVIYASSNTQKEGESVEDISPVAQIALNDNSSSYTTQTTNGVDRLYQTFRALEDNGKVVGLIETTQTLSQADQVIEENIQRGIIIFIIILLAVMYLFFRHSRIIDYVSLYEELKTVDQLKDDFISMASHELKTPLATIRGYSEFITEGETVPEEFKEYSKRIDISSKQLALLVEDMLDVSRIEQGRMKFEETKTLVPDFIKTLVSDFEVLAKEKNLDFKFEYEGLKLGHIVVDQNKLRQILVNVVGNAIKYTNTGEVKISLSNIKEQIEIRVSDTGLGMSEEEREHLFEKFYRVKNDETKDIKGTGLGLWITKQMIEKMGGHISVESIKGVGTHISIKFKATV